MSKPITRLAIVLDRSGSMASTKRQTIEGLNEQIQQAKIMANDHDLRCSLVTFNGEVFEHLWDVSADKLVEANPDDYKPTGSTAMRDAVGYTIQKLINTADADDEKTAYLIYVISDGDTNADTHYNKEAIKELTESCQATGRWTFTYMGHDPRYMEKLAKDTGVPISNMAVWSNRTRAAAKGAMQHQNKRMKKFFDERVGGKLNVENYSSDSPVCMADFTDDQSKDLLAAPATDVKEDAPVTHKVVAKLQDLVANLPSYENYNHQQNGTAGSLFEQSVNVRWAQKMEAKAECHRNRR